MVRSMTDQPGPRDPAERRAPERQAADRQAADRRAAERRAAERRAAERQDRGADVFGDLQRWFIRQSAKNMRREISGQVRRTFSGSRENADVWDTVTHEIPPEVGESPECQWCPICRAARRMRDSGPGIGGQLSGAGDVVASAVQDAISALDSLLGKASGTGRDSAGRDSGSRDSGSRDSGSRDSAAQDSAAQDSAAQASGPQRGASATGPDDGHGASGWPGPESSAPGSRRDRPGLAGLADGTDSAADQIPPGAPARVNGSAPASEPADRLSAAAGTEPDPWGTATRAGDAGQDANDDADPDGPGHQSGGPGHEPDDRG